MPLWTPMWECQSSCMHLYVCKMSVARFLHACVTLSICVRLFVSLCSRALTPSPTVALRWNVTGINDLQFTASAAINPLTKALAGS